MEIVDKIKDIITDPIFFFKGLDKEHDIVDAFSFLALLIIIPAVLGTIVDYFFRSAISMTQLGSFMGEVESIYLVPVMIIGFYILALVFSFVGSALFHLWIKLFGGTGDFAKTFQVYVYSGTPGYLFSWIPLIGGLASIWGLVLIIFGLEEAHGFSRAKAALVCLLPLILIIVVTLVLILTVFAGMMAFFSV